MRVLDLGTGLGHVAFQVAGLLDPDGSVLGIEQAERLLGLDTLQARIAEQVAARDAVMLPPAVVGAWGTRPSVDP